MDKKIITVQLSEEKKEIVATKEKLLITSLGYMKLIPISEIRFITPPLSNESNPHIERDNVGKIKEISLTKIGIVYSSDESYTIVNKTVILNLYQYFLYQLTEKVLSNSECGFLGKPENTPENDKYIFFFLHSSYHSLNSDVDFGIWVNLNHPQIQNFITHHLQLQSFAEKIANILVEIECAKELIVPDQINYNPKTKTAKVKLITYKSKDYKVQLELEKNKNINKIITIPTYQDIQIIEHSLLPTDRDY